MNNLVDKIIGWTLFFIIMTVVGLCIALVVELLFNILILAIGTAAMALQGMVIQYGKKTTENNTI